MHLMDFDGTCTAGICRSDSSNPSSEAGAFNTAVWRPELCSDAKSFAIPERPMASRCSWKICAMGLGAGARRPCHIRTITKNIARLLCKRLLHNTVTQPLCERFDTVLHDTARLHHTFILLHKPWWNVGVGCDILVEHWCKTCSRTMWATFGVWKPFCRAQHSYHGMTKYASRNS